MWDHSCEGTVYFWGRETEKRGRKSRRSSDANLRYTLQPQGDSERNQGSGKEKGLGGRAKEFGKTVMGRFSTSKKGDLILI